MIAMKTPFSVLSLMAALVLATTGSASADPAPLDSGLANPFALSRFSANSLSNTTEKKAFPTKSHFPEAGDGHLLSDFVYYTSLQIQGGVSLLAGGGDFSGGGFIGGSGDGGSGGSTMLGGDEEGGQGDMPANPTPGAALLGMLGLSMIGWVRRRWA